MYWCILIFSALLGALVATYIGYRFRCLENDEAVMYELYALMASVIVTIIAILGALDWDWILFNTRSVLNDIIIVVGLVAMMMGYCYFLTFCSVLGEELNYPKLVRKARRRSRNRDIEAVVTADDVKRALRAYARQEYDAELERMVDLADGIEWVDLDKEDDSVLIVEEIVRQTKQAKSGTHPQPAANHDTPAPRTIARPAAVNTIRALVRNLRLGDLHLVIEAFRREPELFRMLRSNELFAKLEIVGKGDQKRIKIKGAAYPRKKAV